jgi:ubiquinone/menaquinone biosynthesis C-methylase UbiE
VQADAAHLPFRDGAFRLVVADIPYGTKHAARYGTAMPNRKRVLHEVARVTAPGGWLVWLDVKLPMFRKVDWHWCGIVQVVRSTNHDFRGSVFFLRAEQP